LLVCSYHHARGEQVFSFFFGAVAPIIFGGFFHCGAVICFSIPPRPRSLGLVAPGWIGKRGLVVRANNYTIVSCHTNVVISYTGNYNTTHTYNLNGNIGTLACKCKPGGSIDYGILDDPEFEYNGNQLTSVNDVDDTDHQDNGFTDNGPFESIEYFYDANGNMKNDLNKQIGNIEYNHLNLPQRIEFAQSSQGIIHYLYDATGRKLRKQKRVDLTENTNTDYCGSFVYKNNELQYILTEEGRIVPDGGGFRYQYFLKDHLGNTRVMFDDNGDILQDDSYYPFCMAMAGLSFEDFPSSQPNKYLYNGKEMQDEFGLGWYDYEAKQVRMDGARFYDAQLGRFHTLDTLSEEYSFQSPFVYGANNPIMFIDFMGMSPDEYQFNSNGQYTGKVEKEGEHYGTIAGKDGEEATTFGFADPVNDPQAFEDGKITNVKFVDMESVAEALEASGVNDEVNQDSKLQFILNESDASNPNGEGKMDYVVKAKVIVNGKKEPITRFNTLYVTKTNDGNVAHNSKNLGNFIWGAGARSLGFSLTVAKLGAHWNNIRDPHYGGLDSPDDQYSIKLGYKWNKSQGAGPKPLNSTKFHYKHMK